MAVNRVMPVDNQPDTLANVAAVVVLYYPDSDVYMNIASYIDQVDLVILVDNSDDPAFELIERLAHNTKILPVINRCNLGIAAALNIGARAAIAKGCNLLLTMDQDSCAAPGMVELLKGHFKDRGGKPLAIVSPFHLTTLHEMPGPGLPESEEVETAWTSGNLLCLSVYQSVGPFAEDLFIDFVDHEYCLRLKRHGYRIIQSNRAILHHNIGNNLRKVHVLSVPLIVSNHSPLRRYYITRNRFWVTNRYREFRKFRWIDRRRFLAELVTILLFEDQKIKKIVMIIRGYMDYLTGNMGKFGIHHTVEAGQSNV